MYRLEFMEVNQRKPTPFLLCAKAFEKWSIDALAERFPTVRFKISRRHVEADHTGLRLRPAAGRVRMTLKEYAEYQVSYNRQEYYPHGDNCNNVFDS